MRIVRFIGPSGSRVGVQTDGEVVDLVDACEVRGQTWLRPLFYDLRLFLAAGNIAQVAAAELAQARNVDRIPLARVKLLAPFSGGKILAHVVNYVEHGVDDGIPPPSRPFFFYKPPSAVINPQDFIVSHANSQKLDHEVELAVVIGRAGRDIPTARAYEHVAGYTILNDVSFRDLQRNKGDTEIHRHYGQNWTQGKGLDASCPIGPSLVLRDELPEPYPLRISCRVNGKIAQDGTTADMVFKIPELIAEISSGMTLYPGDIVSTGSCASVPGAGFLKPGDMVECEIEKIGILRNEVIEPVAYS